MNLGGGCDLLDRPPLGLLTEEGHRDRREQQKRHVQAEDRRLALRSGEGRDDERADDPADPADGRRRAGTGGPEGRRRSSGESELRLGPVARTDCGAACNTVPYIARATLGSRGLGSRF